MGRLTEAQRNQAIGMLRFESISQVAKFFNCIKSTISRLADRFGQTGTVKDRPRPGQQKKLSVRDERRIRRQHIANPFLEASPTARQFGVTTPTIIKILRKAGRRSRRPFRGQILLSHHKRACWDGVEKLKTGGFAIGQRFSFPMNVDSASLLTVADSEFSDDAELVLSQKI